MKKNKLISYITILTMVLTSGLSNLGMLIYSYAQDKKDLVITDVLNEQPISTQDNKFILDQHVEKVSDTELKINLNIKNKTEDKNISNLDIINTLSDNLEIKSESILVSGGQDKEGAKAEVSSPRDTLNVYFDNMTSGEINVSFIVAIRKNANIGENIPINLRSEIKYITENNEEVVYNFAIPKVTIKEKKILNEASVNTKKEAKKVEEVKEELNEENLEKTTTSGGLETLKTAVDNGDGTFKITLEVKGKPIVTEPKKADIVMVIDSSGSMNDKIQQVTTAAKNFSKNILDSNTGDQVRISVAEFNCGDDVTALGGSSSILTDFTSDINKISNSIDSMRRGGGTHTQDGIWRTSDLLYRSINDSNRKDANRYVVFFTDGLPTYSYNPAPYPGLDDAFKDAQREYYNYFTGYGAPTQVSIGGIGDTLDGGPPQPEVIPVDNQPIYKDAKFYTLGLFTNPREGEKEKAIKFMQTIQNVIEPSKYADKYYTEDLNAINSIFMEISEDIKGDIKGTITEDLVINDIVTKEFDIVDNSWRLTDLNGNEIPIPPGSVIVDKTPDGCDKITVKVGKILAGAIDTYSGVRLSFDVATKDPYFAGDNIKTNVGADITYKDPTTGQESSQNFLEDPTVNIAQKNGNIKVTKNVKNNLGQTIQDDTPFEIVIQRVKDANDPNGIVDYNKTYKLKSTDFNDTGTKRLIGANTVSADGKVILSTDVVNKENYLIAGNYIVKEVNIPSDYTFKEIKINGKILEIPPNSTDKQATFTLSKDSPNIDIEVVNKSNKTNDLIKSKTANKVLDENGKHTGEYEIALSVSTPKADVTTLMHNDARIVYHEQTPGSWEERTVGDSQNGKSYKATNVNGNIITFNFEGTGFEWVAQGNVGEYTNKALVRIYEEVDGLRGKLLVEEPADIYTFTSNDTEHTIYKKHGLAHGKYIVNISSWKSDNSPQNILSIRKLLIYKGETQNTEIKNATITDIVTDVFDIVKDGYGTGKTAVIENPSGTQHTDINTNLSTVTIDNKIYDKLTWHPININSDGITIKFKVKPKDPYFGGTNIDTNVKATVDYVVDGQNSTEEFEKPKVNIPYKQGSINIRKEIVAKSNTNPGGWETIPNDKVNPNDRFSISVVGNQKYTVDLIGNSEANLNFYLKGESTDISNNKDTSLNYFTVGNYSVKELVPMNYEQVEVYIDKTPNTSNPTWVPFNEYVNDKVNIDSGKAKDGKIVIDKDNNDINIKVTNTLVNDRYWQDKADAINEFNYRTNQNIGVFSKIKTTIQNFTNKIN